MTHEWPTAMEVLAALVGALPQCSLCDEPATKRSLIGASTGNYCDDCSTKTTEIVKLDLDWASELRLALEIASSGTTLRPGDE